MDQETNKDEMFNAMCKQILGKLSLEEKPKEEKPKENMIMKDENVFSTTYDVQKELEKKCSRKEKRFRERSAKKLEKINKKQSAKKSEKISALEKTKLQFRQNNMDNADKDRIEKILYNK